MADSIDPITVIVIGRVAQHRLEASDCPAKPAMVKIIGICAPKMAWAATSTQTLRRAKASSNGGAGEVALLFMAICLGPGDGAVQGRNCIGINIRSTKSAFGIVVLPGRRNNAAETSGKSMVGRIIETDACVAEGAAWLAGQDARFARALAETGPLPLRRKPDGFATLLDAIVGQQVSIASASAIWSRLETAGLTDAGAVAAGGG